MHPRICTFSLVAYSDWLVELGIKICDSLKTLCSKSKEDNFRSFLVLGLCTYNDEIVLIKTVSSRAPRLVGEFCFLKKVVYFRGGVVGQLTHFEFRYHSRSTINHLDNQESLIFGVSEALFQSTAYSSPIYNLSLFLYSYFNCYVRVMTSFVSFLQTVFRVVF